MSSVHIHSKKASNDHSEKNALENHKELENCQKRRKWSDAVEKEPNIEYTKLLQQSCKCGYGEGWEYLDKFFSEKKIPWKL